MERSMNEAGVHPAARSGNRVRCRRRSVRRSAPSLVGSACFMTATKTGAPPIEIASLMRDVPDFPKPGVLFKDITTLIRNGPAFKYVVDQITARYHLAQI